MKDNKLYSSAHKTNGWRKWLESPQIFNLWQKVSGAESWKRRIIKEYAKPFANSRILDVGCGTGSLLNHMDENLKVNFVGCDINADYIDYAKNKYKDKGAFYCCGADDLPSNENDFDIIFAISIFHHLDETTSNSLFKSLKEKLKKGGIFLMSDPVWSDNHSRFKKYLMKKDRGQNIRTEKEYLRLAGKEFSEIQSCIVKDSHFIPWTVNVIICK